MITTSQHVYWPEHQCNDVSIPSRVELEQFTATLNDANDESPLQTFLAAHSHLLSCLLPPGRNAWCFDRPRLGSEFIPDFLLCTTNSTGFQWRMVELESPVRPPLTKDGLPSSKLNQAFAQVRDWRSWLRSNVAYAQNQLRFQDLDAECHGFIVIGRRDLIDQRHSIRYRELSDNRITVMTYDRLLEAMARGRTVTEVFDEQ